MEREGRWREREGGGRGKAEGEGRQREREGGGRGKVDGEGRWREREGEEMTMMCTHTRVLCLIIFLPVMYWTPVPLIDMYTLNKTIGGKVEPPNLQ